MFEDCDNLIEVDLSNFISDNVKYMSSTFYHCGALEAVNFANFKSSNLVTMYAAFEKCDSLTGLDLSSFDDLSNLKSMNSLFKDCQKLSYLNLQNFKFKNEVNLRDILLNTFNLKIIIIQDSTTKNKIYYRKQFSNDTNINCDIGDNEKCKECSNNEGEKYKCKSCNEGYFLPDIKFPTSCIECFIDNCNICSNNINCESCKNGFYLSQNKEECQACGEGCINCTDSNNCITCNENYNLNNGICIYDKDEIYDLSSTYIQTTDVSIPINSSNLEITDLITTFNSNSYISLSSNINTILFSTNFIINSSLFTTKLETSYINESLLTSNIILNTNNIYKDE